LPSGFDTDLAAGLSLLLEDLSAFDDEESGCLLFLKSVSYQPVPLSLNDEADTSLVSADFPHLGQSLSGSSLIFCNFSNRWSHSVHLYS